MYQGAVRDFGRFTPFLRRIFGIYLGLLKKAQKVTTCKPVGLGNTRILD